MKEEAINETLSASEWTEVTLGSGQTCNTYAAQVRDGSGFKMKRRSDSTAYWTAHDREKVIIDEVRGVAGDILFYAQAVTGTPVLEVIITKG
jgi:hypothetical protein